MTSLNMRNNKLKEFDFEHFSNLSTADLSFNKIKKLKNLSLHGNLLKLNLEYNKVKSIPKVLILPKLKSMNLLNNDIKQTVIVRTFQPARVDIDKNTNLFTLPHSAYDQILAHKKSE